MITTIRLSPKERAQGKLDAEQVERAVQAIERDGVVVLEDVVPLPIIETLRDKLLEDVQKLIARTDGPFNWVRGNVQQDPPPFPPYLFREVMVNEYAIQVTHAILGNGLKNGLYSGNTAMPSEERQPVHADLGQLWPRQKTAHPPYALVVNLPLVDMGPENGSTEIWPGTHLDTSVTMSDGDIKVSVEAQEARRAVCPPLQPEVKAGSILIRDIRMWHAGMPNRTDRPRPMIAHVHHVSWWPTGAIKFVKGSEPFLEHPVLHTHAEFLDAVDHISAPQSYEFAKS